MGKTLKMKVFQVESNAAHFNARERYMLGLEGLARAHAQGPMLIVAASYAAAVRIADAAGYLRLRREHMSEFGGPTVELLDEAGLLVPDSMLMYTMGRTGPIVRFTAEQGLRVVGEWLSDKQVRATDTNTVATKPVGRGEKRRTMQAMDRRFRDLRRAAEHMRDLGDPQMAEKLSHYATKAHEEANRLDKELYG